MEPVMLIEVLDTHGHVRERHRLTQSGAACKIGRSVGCEIVLDDAYAAAEHTTLTLLADGRVSITDLESRNGTRLNGKRISSDMPTSMEDGELIVGRTRLLIRTAHTQLPPERLFRRDLLERHKTALAIAGLTLALTFAGFDQWLSAPEQLVPRMLTVMLGVIATIAIWISLWGLVTRIGHGAWSLRVHIAIAANALAVGAWSVWLIGAVGFALERDLAPIAALIAGAALIAALYFHLRKATHLSRRTAVIVTASIPLVLGITVGWLNQQNNAHNVNRIVLGADIYPPQWRVTTSTELNDYLTHLNALKREANRKRQESLAETPIAAK